MAMGLAVQLEYNKQGEQILALCNLLKKYALPLYLFDIPIAPTKENMENLNLPWQIQILWQMRVHKGTRGYVQLSIDCLTPKFNKK